MTESSRSNSLIAETRLLSLIAKRNEEGVREVCGESNRLHSNAYRVQISKERHLFQSRQTCQDEGVYVH